MLGSAFWIVLGLGLAIPCTILVILNLGIKMVNGDEYELNLGRLGFIYLIALLGWSVLMGIWLQ